MTFQTNDALSFKTIPACTHYCIVDNAGVFPQIGLRRYDERKTVIWPLWSFTVLPLEVEPFSSEDKKIQLLIPVESFSAPC